jgi:MoaA/NifB/PqqE/SkfB family radical SAM enzyme
LPDKRRTSSRSKYLASRARRVLGLSPRRQFQVLLNRAERKLGRSRLLSKPQRLDLVPTQRCNLRCVGCVKYEAEGRKDLDLEFFREVLDESAPWVVGYKFCSIGEPFMNKDLPEMLERSGKRGVPATIVTNGTLIDADLAEFLVTRTKMNVLTFSIDGATAETCEKIRRGLDFDRLLDAVRLVVEAKQRHGKGRPLVSCNFVAMRENIGELPDLVRLAAETGIEEINVNYLTIEWEAGRESSLFDHRDLQEKMFTEARRASEETGVVLHLPPDIRTGGETVSPKKGSVPFLPFLGRCPFPWDTMIIDTDGTVRLCYMAWEESIGNVKTDGGILRVWNSAAYRKVRETIGGEKPHYRYCAYCGRQRGYSRIEAHLGKTGENAGMFGFEG